MRQVPEFVEQGQNTTCCAVALINACIHLGINPPPLDLLISEMHCDTGAAIGFDSTAERVLGDAAQKCAEPDLFFERGGILTIMHPIFNLHACLCLADGRWENGETHYTLVNSWLGPLVCCRISRGEIEMFTPSPWGNHDMWSFTGLPVGGSPSPF